MENLATSEDQKVSMVQDNLFGRFVAFDLARRLSDLVVPLWHRSTDTKCS